MIGRKYPDCGYGSGFNKWLFSDTRGPYNSFGNGSAMRVSPIAYAAVTHNHPEGIKGAQAIAYTVWLARHKHSKNDILAMVENRFKYDLGRTVGDIAPTYSFDVTCQGSVPEAIIAFLDSNNFEEAIRYAIYLGGDADTQACMAGAIAEAFYGDIPKNFVEQARSKLTPELLKCVEDFYRVYVK